MSRITNAECYDAGTNEDYHAGEGVSNSQLSVALEDPAEFHGLFVDGSIERRAPTPDMLVGTYLHEMALEGEIKTGVVVPDGAIPVTAEKNEELQSRLRLAVRVPDHVLNEHGHCKGGKYLAWRKGFPKEVKTLKDSEYRELSDRVRLAFVVEDGENVISSESLDQLHGMLESLRSHVFASRLLFGDGESEVPIRGVDSETGIQVRCKLDRVSMDPSDPFIADLKTTIDPSPKGFASAVDRFGYHRQHVFYSRIAESAFGHPVPFWFVVVAKKPPYRVEVYQLDPAWIDLGNIEVDRGLDTIRRCQQSGVWRHEHYGSPLVLPMPRYVNYKNEWEVN